MKRKCLIFRFSSYVITVPKTFRPGMLVNMSILLLKANPPGTPVDINATFVINSFPISTASGQFHAGRNNYRSCFP